MDNPEEMVNDSQMNLPLPEELRDEFDERTNNKSETLRRMIYGYCQAEEKYGVGDDLDYINVVMLKAYRNAIQQNIQLLQNQVDKIDEELEEYEDEDEDVVIEIDLDVATKHL